MTCITVYVLQVCVVQVSPTQLQVRLFTGDSNIKLDAGMQVSYLTYNLEATYKALIIEMVYLQIDHSFYEVAVVIKWL